MGENYILDWGKADKSDSSTFNQYFQPFRINDFHKFRTCTLVSLVFHLAISCLTVAFLRSWIWTSLGRFSFTYTSLHTRRHASFSFLNERCFFYSIWTQTWSGITAQFFYFLKILLFGTQWVRSAANGLVNEDFNESLLPWIGMALMEVWRESCVTGLYVHWSKFSFFFSSNIQGRKDIVLFSVFISKLLSLYR